MCDDNRFRWIGRHQDMLKIGGKRESLSDLNLRLATIDGVDDGVIFMPDPKSRRPAALVVSKQLRPRDIRSALARHVDAVFLPRPIFHVDELPRQETGKIARSKLIAAYHDLLRRSSRGST
jgi:acyl-coenzyme A synthetase/AMP-(fatty) acid ligase